jgi:protein-S-isoprenylcysteine O-methyltransferase Ste14
MSASSSINTMMIMMAMFAVVVACGGVYAHMHPEMLDSVKTWFSTMVKIPSL